MKGWSKEVKTTSYYLTRDEALLLDGKCRPELQKHLEELKVGLSFNSGDPEMDAVLAEAVKNGKFGWTHDTCRACRFCDKTYEYAKYKSTTQYHRKGEDNRNKPIDWSGFKFNPGFVRVRGTAQMCSSCFNVWLPKLIDLLLERDEKVEIQQNQYKPSRYIWDRVHQCFQCEKEMYESEMGRSPVLMGGGTYASTCPHCQAKSAMFGGSHKWLDKWRAIPVKEPTQ